MPDQAVESDEAPEVAFASPFDVDRRDGSDFETRTAPTSTYWGTESSSAAPLARPYEQLWGGRSSDGSPMGVAVAEPPAPPMIDKPDPLLVAIIADDDATGHGVEYPTPGGPLFAGAGNATAPIGPPGMPVVTSENPAAPVTARGSFMAAWSSPARDKVRKALRRQRIRKRVRRLVVLLLVCAGAYVVYPRVHTLIVARTVAPDLRSYVEGEGASFAPAAEGYSVRLPKGPVLSAPQLTAASLSLPMIAHSAVVVGSDYRIVVWDGPLPGGALPKGALGALRDPKIGGTGRLAAVRSVEIAGETAYVGTFTSSDALPRRVAVMVHRGRLFVIRAQAESAGAVFETLARSFRFTRPG